MSYRLTRLTALDGDTILPLYECKAHLRVDSANEDALIAALRDAAIGYVERVSGVALAEAQFRWAVPTFTTRMDLPVQPVTSVDGVAYTGDDGAEAAYEDAQLIDGSAAAAIGGKWPCPNGYAAIEFTAGLGSPGDAPELLAAAKLMLTHLYENRGAVAQSDKVPVEVPLGVSALINLHRRMVV